MRRPKMIRRPIYLDADADRLLTEATKRHKASRGAVIRARLKGHRVGADPGTEAAAADAWWDSRSAERRVSIYRNHATIKAAEHDPAQLTIFDEGA